PQRSGSGQRRDSRLRGQLIRFAVGGVRQSVRGADDGRASRHVRFPLRKQYGRRRPPGLTSSFKGLADRTAERGRLARTPAAKMAALRPWDETVRTATRYLLEEC